MKKIFLGVVVASMALCALEAKKCNKPCTKVTNIESVPYVISEPGKYMLCKDVTYTGTGAAITISSSDVELNLFAHNITLTDPAATGIDIFKGDTPEDRICCIRITNDSIKNTSLDPQTGNGIHIRNACKVQLHNLFTVNHEDGLLIENSQDIMVESCQFYNAQIWGAQVHGSSLVTFEKCTFKDNDTSLEITVFMPPDAANIPCQDIKILNCSFPNAFDTTHIDAQAFDGLIIEHTTFSVTANTNEDMLFLNGSNSIIKCCTFSTDQVIDSILDFRGSGIIIESCLFESTFLDPIPTNDHLINLFGSLDVLIKGCTITGSATKRGIRSFFASNVLIQDTLIQNCFRGIELEGAFANTIERCIVSNCASSGIFLTNGATANVVTDCLITNTSTNITSPAEGGIHFEADFVSTDNVIKNNAVSRNNEGIKVTATNDSNTIFNNDVMGNLRDGIDINTALNNSVQHNRAYSNLADGIDQNTGDIDDNEFYFNTAHDNTDNNYENVPVIVNPGDTPTLEGSNIEPS